jgi:NADH-quinone oxidoreductase subunit F
VNKALGRDFTLDSLRSEGYEAVFLGLGAPKGSRLGIANEDTQGVTDAIDFLREYNLRGSAPVGKRVVVIGGGNAAIDAARTALRLGADQVTVLYRRTRDEMPAYKEEIEEAVNEGVLLKMLVAPQEIVVKDGRVAGVKCQHMWLGEYDRSGRRRPEARAGEEAFIEDADQVIAAIGQSLELKPLVDGLDLKLTPSKFIWTDPLYGQTSVEWLFAGGDSAAGPSSVADAIGGGERAAVGIDRFLSGEEHAFWREPYQVDTEFDVDADPSDAPRARMKLLPVSKRAHNFSEVEIPFTETVAVREARRCLRCDYRETAASTSR